MRPRSDLHDYQLRAIELAKRSKCVAWIDVGLGKTITALTAFAELQDIFEAGKALVIGPKKVAINVWPEEVREWQHVSHLRMQVMTGSPAKRLEALNAPADVHVINVENVPWLEKQLCLDPSNKKLAANRNKKLPWDVLILDESSLFKSRDGKRFKSMARMARMAKRVLLLTASPASNSYVDLWSQYYIVDGGVRLHAGLGEYQMRYFTPVGQKEATRWVLKNNYAKTCIHDRIRDITFAMRKEDYQKLPPLHNIECWVDLDDKQREMYDFAEQEYVIKIAQDTLIAAPTTAALYQKLQQLANGQVYDEERNVHRVHDAKLQKLDELYEAAAEPVLVIYQFQSDRDAILRMYPEATLLDDDPETVRSWNRGEIPMLVMHPKSGGHGLNLQRGGATLIWVGLNWSLELFEQVVGRLYRQGQWRPVKNFMILTRDTIDDLVWKAIKRKEVSQSALKFALRLLADLRTRDTVDSDERRPVSLL